MSPDSAHKNYWQTPEVIFGLPFLLVILLQLVAPFPLPGGVPRLVYLLTGIALITAGVALRAMTPGGGDPSGDIQKPRDLQVQRV